jgi:hypothetical protein
MFVRKRVRDCEKSVHFTVAQALRTTKGPRQRVVVSWTSPTNPEHPHYAPAFADAIRLYEDGGGLSFMP